MTVSLLLPGPGGSMSETVGTEVFHRDGEEDHYEYEIHASGALIVWSIKRGAADAVLEAYGPGAWLKVSGSVYQP
ncbi:hypothetical protein [Streptomyces sp. NPDC008141]|uniref:hypothetical protein n=1 Tax=Streptomyces sp. NPDC008141 TaxID=3364815 RepID=UPI0036ECDC29